MPPLVPHEHQLLSYLSAPLTANLFKSITYTHFFYFPSSHVFMTLFQPGFYSFIPPVFFPLLWTFLLVLPTFTKVSNTSYIAKANGRASVLLFSTHQKQFRVDPSLPSWNTIFIWFARCLSLWFMPYLSGHSPHHSLMAPSHLPNL